MTNTVTASNTQNSSTRQSHGAIFAKVLDGRKQPIRGLWLRNGRYYARLNVEDLRTGKKKSRRIPLLDKDSRPIESIPEARELLNRLRIERADNTLPMLQQNPKLAEYIESYLQSIGAGQGAKKPGTVAKERSALKRWKRKFGELRLNQIRRFHVHSFMDERLHAGMSPRTVNLDVIALRNVLNRAIEEQRIRQLPMDGMKPLKTTSVRRPFFNAADLDKLCQAAFLTKKNPAKKTAEDPARVPVTKNAQEFIDYIRLLAYSGARRNEALVLRWHDVDFQTQQLTIGAEGDTKNRTGRVVDFNPKLKAHLLDMHRRRQPDSQWIFPSPQRGERDVAAKTFQISLAMVRDNAGVPELREFHFHDCRHHFISLCVMSGVDFMTIAAWVGHRDGGVLIGKVYGHLANEHRKRMAGQVVFDPTVLAAPAAA